MRRFAYWLLVPLAGVAAALVATAQRGNLIADGQVIPIPWHTLLIDNLIAFGWWVLLAPVIAVIVRRIQGARLAVIARVAAHAVAGAAFIALYFLLRAHVSPPWSSFTISGDIAGLRSILPAATVIYLLIASVTIALASQARALAREREARRLEAQLTGARLELLRAQLHPHFLFNSLNAVSSLMDASPGEARRMLTRLSDLLRLAVELADEREIPLARELEWVERYLELQEIRFEERLTVDIRAAPDALGALVPPLVLQPLVENAIKFAVEPRVSGGRIEIAAERRGERVHLVVRDDGPGPSAAGRSDGTGVGLSNTRARLEALHGPESRLELREAALGGAEAVVELPYRGAPATEPTARAVLEASR